MTDRKVKASCQCGWYTVLTIDADDLEMVNQAHGIDKKGSHPFEGSVTVFFETKEEPKDDKVLVLPGRTQRRVAR